MTFDGHIKTGLAATLFLSAALPVSMPDNAELSNATLPAMLILFFAGNVAPDLLEFRVGEATLIRHRTHTHYPWYYIVLIALLFLDINTSNLITPDYSYMLVALFAGCLTHIICDIPYGGIPYLTPRRKVTFIRIPFDSFFNRLIEHIVVVSLVLGYFILSADIDVSKLIDDDFNPEKEFNIQVDTVTKDISPF
jgi:hypothetical protein